MIKITGWYTGSGQVRKILDYNGTTLTATVDTNWSTAPTDTSEYNIYDAAVTIFGDLNVNRTVSSDNTTITDSLIKLAENSTTSGNDWYYIYKR